MSSIFGKLGRSICSNVIQRQDRVVLDIINTVMHQECCNRERTAGKQMLPIRDGGPFRKILLTYGFFGKGSK